MGTEGAAAGKGLPDGRAWQRAKQALIGSGLLAIASQHAEVQKQQAELATQKLKIREIAQALQPNIVVVPITGKVLQIQVRDGDGVSVGKSLLTLGNPAIELIRLSLSTLNASKVALDQTARITVIGTKGNPF